MGSAGLSSLMSITADGVIKENIKSQVYMFFLIHKNYQSITTTRPFVREQVVGVMLHGYATLQSTALA